LTVPNCMAMATGKIDIGYEMMVRATVTSLWQDGSITVQFKSAGQRLTLPNANDIIATNNGRPPSNRREGERLL
jgi:hypothetical protein